MWNRGSSVTTPSHACEPVPKVEIDVTDSGAQQDLSVTPGWSFCQL